VMDSGAPYLNILAGGFVVPAWQSGTHLGKTQPVLRLVIRYSANLST
jgi:hypothetical protein